MVVGGGRDAVPMMVSLLYRAVRTMLSIPVVLLRRDVAKDAELLV
jgi:putative transposase